MLRLNYGLHLSEKSLDNNVYPWGWGGSDTQSFKWCKWYLHHWRLCSSFPTFPSLKKRFCRATPVVRLRKTLARQIQWNICRFLFSDVKLIQLKVVDVSWTREDWFHHERRCGWKTENTFLLLLLLLVQTVTPRYLHHSWSGQQTTELTPIPTIYQIICFNPESEPSSGKFMISPRLEKAVVCRLGNGGSHRTGDDRKQGRGSRRSGRNRHVVFIAAV